jgi:vacuolar protein sorting-associated protein 35
VVEQLPTDQRKRFASELVENILSNETALPDVDEIDTLFKYLATFVQATPADKDLGPEDWEDDQTKVAYVIQMINSTEIDQQFAVLMKAYQHISEGGKNRIKFTFPALVFKALSLVQRIYATERTDSPPAGSEDDAPWEKKLKRIFKFTNDLVTALKNAELLQLAYRLYLECALAAGRAQMRIFAYGFLTKGAIAIYEDDAMAQSKMEYDAIRLLVSTVNSLDCFDEENYTFLATRLAQHSSKLLNLDDQSRAVEMSAHLFVAKLDGGKNKYEAPDRVLSCLKKAMTVAGNIHESDVMIELLVDLLDRFLYFYDSMPQAVDVAYINAIIKKIHKHFTISSLPSTHPAIVHFTHVKAHVLLKGWKDIQF